MFLIRCVSLGKGLAVSVNLPESVPAVSTHFMAYKVGAPGCGFKWPMALGTVVVFPSLSHPPTPLCFFFFHTFPCMCLSAHTRTLGWGAACGSWSPSIVWVPGMELGVRVGIKLLHPLSPSAPQADAGPARPSILPHSGRESAMFRASHLLCGQGDLCPARCPPLGSPRLP